MSFKTVHCQHPEMLIGKPGECSPQQMRHCHSIDPSHPAPPPGPEELLQNFEKQEGFIPNPLVMMSKRSGLLPKFMGYGKAIFEGGPLSERERYLIALAAAAALKSGDCMAAQSKRALKHGASQEEVLQTLLIAGLISNTSALHTAYDAVELIWEMEAAE